MNGRTCTREQVREIDRRAKDEYGMPGVMLMENAGCGVARIALDMLGDAAGKQVVIFCGRGNNGGDGFVAARHLHNAGCRVSLILAAPQDQLESVEGEAAMNFCICEAMRLPLLDASTVKGQAQAAAQAKLADLIIDALLGTGLSGQVRDPYLTLIRLINAEDKPVLAVDIPSGLDANTGQVLRAAVRCRETATFVLPKIGFTLLEGPSHVGKVSVVDIGVPKELVDSVMEKKAGAE